MVNRWHSVRVQFFLGGAILLSVVSHFFTEGAFLPVVAPFELALG